MLTIVLSCSPNKDGLTAACAHAALEGARSGGSDAEIVWVNDLAIARCNNCGNGWGGCRKFHECRGVMDDFQALHARLQDADAIVLASPVYWGEMSESAKALTDRLRRCEATKGDESTFADVPILGVAAAGGSGNGTVTCMLSMERWIQHVRGHRWDLVPVNRWVREVKVDAIRASAEAMVASLSKE